MGSYPGPIPHSSSSAFSLWNSFSTASSLCCWTNAVPSTRWVSTNALMAIVRKGELRIDVALIGVAPFLFCVCNKFDCFIGMRHNVAILKMIRSRLSVVKLSWLNVVCPLSQLVMPGDSGGSFGVFPFVCSISFLCL